MRGTGDEGPEVRHEAQIYFWVLNVIIGIERVGRVFNEGNIEELNLSAGEIECSN